ncbi:MAG: hypothetical protein IJ223_00115 [Clostridia bacterium]|nr:hypothetical protein [Clostridia bacterium]
MEILARIKLRRNEKKQLITEIRKGNSVTLKIEFEDVNEEEKEIHIWDIPEISALRFRGLGFLHEDIDDVLMLLETKEVFFENSEVTEISKFAMHPEECKKHENDESIKKLKMVLKEHFGSAMTCEQFLKEVMFIRNLH